MDDRVIMCDTYILTEIDLDSNVHGRQEDFFLVKYLKI